MDTGPDNRDANFEVKNGVENLDTVANWHPVHSGHSEYMDQVSLSPEITTSARLASPANQANFDAGNATKKQAKDAAQMPQSNATNATMQNIEFAQPSGWGKLWRLVQNGNYYYYELRFINADRVRQKGGKITPAIARKLAARKGKGRHEKSRKEAERFRGAAEHLAERIRAIS